MSLIHFFLVYKNYINIMIDVQGCETITNRWEGEEEKNAREQDNSSWTIISEN